jgi:hypothetical protein
MQIGMDLKIKKYDPKILFHTVRHAILYWLGVSATQLTLNDVAFSNVKTVKKTIGGVGVTGCDFNFVTAANTNEQVIDLGAIIPALARILDVKTHTPVGFASGSTTLVAETGISSSGNELIASATVMAKDAITAAAHAEALNNAPSASAAHVYVSATPGANWSAVTTGKIDVYITYIEV